MTDEQYCLLNNCASGNYWFVTPKLITALQSLISKYEIAKNEAAGYKNENAYNKQQFEWMQKNNIGLSNEVIALERLIDKSKDEIRDKDSLIKVLQKEKELFKQQIEEQQIIVNNTEDIKKAFRTVVEQVKDRDRQIVERDSRIDTQRTTIQKLQSLNDKHLGILQEIVKELES